MRDIVNGSPLYADWYFTEGDKQVGPVSFADLESKYRSGYLLRNTLVWTASFGEDWKELGTFIVDDPIEDRPPATPLEEPPNFWFYALILSPIPLILPELLLWYIFPTVNYLDVFISLLFIALLGVMCALDMQALRDSRRKDIAQRLDFWMIFLVPLYIYLRARWVTGKGLIPLTIWLITLFLNYYIIEIAYSYIYLT